MEFITFLQLAISVFMPITLWLVNKAYEEGKADRAEILGLLHETRSRQDKIEERLYRLELEFELRSEPPTFMKRPAQDQQQ